MDRDYHFSPYVYRDKLIHILDAEALTCEQLSVLFRLEGFQTTFSMDSLGFFASVGRRLPDVVITNARVGADSGIDIMRRVKDLKPGTPVFVVQDVGEVDQAVSAMKAGAIDVLTKPVDAERLIEGVRNVLREVVHVGAENGGRRTVEVRGFAQLTPREREVLELITNGQSNKEAGRELGISPRTIEVHRARVMEKLGAKNTADLLRIVLTS